MIHIKEFIEKYEIDDILINVIINIALISTFIAIFYFTYASNVEINIIDLSCNGDDDSENGKIIMDPDTHELNVYEIESTGGKRQKRTMKRTIKRIIRRIIKKRTIKKRTKRNNKKKKKNEKRKKNL